MIKSRFTFQNALFTPSEHIVLQYVAEGLNCSQMAEKLFVTKETIKKHRKNMVKKLGVRNMFELLLKLNAINT